MSISNSLAAVGLAAFLAAVVAATAYLAWAGYEYMTRDESRIQVACGVGTLSFMNRCDFTNTGTGPGARCVIVELVNQAWDVITSSPVCSGELAAHDTAKRPVMFVDDDPHEFCGGDIEENCELEIRLHQ